MARLPNKAMKTLIAEVLTRPDGSTRPAFYCAGVDGFPDRAVSDTLLDLIAESQPPSDQHLDLLIKRVESGAYTPSNAALPDWSVNDKNVWLTPPMAKPGCICVSNENSGDLSVSDGGTPQQFTYEQFRLALKHWREFRSVVEREGKDNLVGRRFEATFPDQRIDANPRD